MRLPAAVLVASIASAPAHATGFTDAGFDLEAHQAEPWSVELDGYLRVRGALFGNLDLDRGPLADGELLFPVPLDDPRGQTLTGADLRLRADLAIYALGGGVAVKTRVDVIDTTLGGDPNADPATTTGQSPLPLVVRRAYGEALTPVGLLSAGRMGAHWGLGMVANGGDDIDGDGGDAADRIAFITPLAGHIWAIAWDFAATLGEVPRRGGQPAVGSAPDSDVEVLTFAMLRWFTELTRARRHEAGRTTLEYGLTASWRWQDVDLPEHTNLVVPRGLGYGLADVWLRVQSKALRVELEAAVLWGGIDEVSQTPGVHFRDAITSLQWGFAVESELGATRDVFTFGLDLGAASGDPSPGFDGAQAALPFDTRADAFRFHADYRVDRILFRELIGTVTDAAYLRPHARVRLVDFPRGELVLSLAVIASLALEPASTPGGARALGVELDPTLAYRSTDGFECALEHALLLPLAGLDNPALDLPAKPAQLLRLRLGYRF